MITKTIPSLSQTTTGPDAWLRILHLPSWLIAMSASLVCGIGSGWAVIAHDASVPTPFVAAMTMMLATFAGWYAWAFFTCLLGRTVLNADWGYQETLECFASAYAFQSLGFFAFVQGGTLWVWAGAYLTIATWAIIAPRRLGMRTWQAVASATLGFLAWLACLLVFVLVFRWDGAYLGIGAFLV